MRFSLAELLKKAGRTVLQNPIIVLPAALQAALPLLFAAVFNVAITAVYMSPLEFRAYTYQGKSETMIAYVLFVLIDILITVGFIAMLKQTFYGRARLRDFFAGIWKNSIRFVLSGSFALVIVAVCCFLIFAPVMLFPMLIRLVVGLLLTVVAMLLLQIWTASFAFEGAKPITAPLERAYSFVKGYFPYLLVPALAHLTVGMLEPGLWSYVTGGLKIGSYHLVVAVGGTAVITKPAVVICCLVLHTIWDLIATLWFFSIYHHLKLEVNAVKHSEPESSGVQLA